MQNSRWPVKQKWQEIDFWEKSPVDYTGTLWVKIFIENALSRTVFEMLKSFILLLRKIVVFS